MSQHVYFMGIAGTGMASVAGLAMQGGFRVSGSDNDVYPPMSTMLEEIGIKVHTPYDPANLSAEKPDLVVVANVLSRNHKEVVALLESKIPYTSFPAFLGEYFLGSRHSVVVTGTHGKTTTTSLLTHILREFGEDPGYLIGGIPKALQRSFNLGSGSPFVIEGDEYDTAYFDKESKFLHYRAQHLILNNIEFDHADIFKDINAIYEMFTKLVKNVANPSQIIANVDDVGVLELLRRTGLEEQVTRVGAWGKNLKTDCHVIDTHVVEAKPEKQIWEIKLATKRWNEIKLQTTLSGAYNAANICQIIACLDSMMSQGIIKQQKADALQKAILSFANVKRRLDHLGTVNDIYVMEDFAHHPTAVGLLIEALRKNFPTRRIIVAFEPRNATSRRRTFEQQYAEVLTMADIALIGACPEDIRIPEAERMNTNRIASTIGPRAKAFDKNDDLHNWLAAQLCPGDVVVFMSSGSFNGVQYRLIDTLNEKYPSHDAKDVEQIQDSH